MKEKIFEVENYFINKITACEFDLEKIEMKDNEWVEFETKIDGYKFDFSIEPKLNLFCNHFSFMAIQIPRDRLQNLIKLIETHEEEAKAEKIKKLKAELAGLETA